MTATELATSQASSAQAEPARNHFRVAIVGSGFAGLAMARALKREGIDDFVVFERAGDLGGVWRDNTYRDASAMSPRPCTRFHLRPTPTGLIPTPSRARSWNTCVP